MVWRRFVGLGIGVASVFLVASALAADAEDELLAGAMAQRERGELAGAEATLRKALARAPQASGERRIALAWELSRVLVARRDFAKALGACSTVASARGGRDAALVCEAEALNFWRKGEDALAKIAQVSAAAPASVRYAAKVAEGRAGELTIDDARAEAAYRDAIAIDSVRHEAHALLGALLVRKGRDGSESLRKALHGRPTDPELKLALAAALAPGEESVRLLEEALATRPGLLDAHVELARQKSRLGQLSDAERHVAAALAADGKHGRALVLSAELALGRRDATQALAQAQKALAVRANDARAKLAEADALALRGDIDLAMASYQTAWGLDRSKPDALIHAAYAAIAAGRRTSARAFGAAAAHEHPDRADALVAHGDALAADRDRDKARAAYDQALRASEGPVDRRAIEARIRALRH